MNIQTDIKWIKNDLNTVRDPDLIEVFKRLLLLRKKTLKSTHEEYNNDIAESEKDIQAGRIHTQNEIKNMKEEWKKSR